MKAMLNTETPNAEHEDLDPIAARLQRFVPPVRCPFPIP